MKIALEKGLSQAQKNGIYAIRKQSTIETRRDGFVKKIGLSFGWNYERVLHFFVDLRELRKHCPIIVGSPKMTSELLK